MKALRDLHFEKNTNKYLVIIIDVDFSVVFLCLCVRLCVYVCRVMLNTKEQKGFPTEKN